MSDSQLNRFISWRGPAHRCVIDFVSVFFNCRIRPRKCTKRRHRQVDANINAFPSFQDREVSTSSSQTLHVESSPWPQQSGPFQLPRTDVDDVWVHTPPPPYQESETICSVSGEGPPPCTREDFPVANNTTPEYAPQSSYGAVLASHSPLRSSP